MEDSLPNDECLRMDEEEDYDEQSDESYSSGEVDELKLLDYQEQQMFSPIKSDSPNSVPRSDITQFENNGDDHANNVSTNIVVDDEDFEPIDLNNLPKTVSILRTDQNNTVYLVGTSHFSTQSHRDVRRVCASFCISDWLV